MLGNDVVDLRDRESRAPRHPRFDRRVFEPSERDLLRRSGAPDRLRWMLWAAKEGAYKALRRLDPTLVFSPVRFVVDLAADGTGTVVHERHPRPLPVMVEETPDFVHALVSLLPTSPRVRVGRLRPAEPQGRAARRLVIDLAAALTSLPACELEVVRRGRIPGLARAGTPLPLVVSLSHHGRFAACAVGRAPAIPALADAPVVRGYAPAAPAPLEVAS